MRYIALCLAGTAALSTLLPANADQFKLPEEIGRVEGSRDMNLLQLEPSVLNERYYTKGTAERHQYVGNVLPYGAPIPDVEEPLSKQKTKVSTPATQTQKTIQQQELKQEPKQENKLESKTESRPTAKPDEKLDTQTAPKPEQKPELKQDLKQDSKDNKTTLIKKSQGGYYSSGKAERHQFIGNVLPAGAPIPDNE